EELVDMSGPALAFARVAGYERGRLIAVEEHRALVVDDALLARDLAFNDLRERRVEHHGIHPTLLHQPVRRGLEHWLIAVIAPHHARWQRLVHRLGWP